MLRTRLLTTAIAVLCAADPGATSSQADRCSASARTVLDVAATLMAGDQPIAAAATLEGASRADGACELLKIAELALVSWNLARAAAPHGGSSESLAPARKHLQQLEALAVSPSYRLDTEYGRSAAAAAIAAAQDERDEMALHLTHARNLASRATSPPLWPRPIDELEGELWLEVDRYAEARESYQRSVTRGWRLASLIGLARATARLGDRSTACDAYRQVLSIGTGPSLDEARTELALHRCGHQRD